ncbi:hypothetical protein TSOC_011906 [Tetrabaena socialis]|uniref:Uncharacterized protein n=1 Tax=Tetrabaena socialis TaxID=47790 RepID=A0A2J7ZPH1_9CHLO|nr:hypothetical protein TSOC_011906 [Tetrabaena socialis]|eukprot:PNH02142.1 hypothetical protein TSOC_011906 [Tetrabaena socialis]
MCLHATWGWGYWIRDMNAQCYAGELGQLPYKRYITLSTVVEQLASLSSPSMICCPHTCTPMYHCNAPLHGVYAGAHLSLYLPIGVVAFHLFCLAPPLVFYALLWCKRKQLSTLSTIQRFGFLFTRYRPKYFWWESVLMLQELSLVAVEVFGRALADVSHQILLMLAAFFLISIINVSCSPIKSHLISLLEFLSLAVLSLTLTLRLVSHQILLMLAAFFLISIINVSCSPIKSHLISLLEFLSLAVLSLTLTLSLYFVVGEELEPGPTVRLAAMLSGCMPLRGFH